MKPDGGDNCPFQKKNRKYLVLLTLLISFALLNFHQWELRKEKSGTKKT